MLPIDMTSTWIPLSLLAVLCAYMVHLFRQERREALAFEAAETTSAATPVVAEAPAVEMPAAPPAPEEIVPALSTGPRKEAAPKNHRSFIWRWWAMKIWVPLIAGFAGQGYLDFIQPLVEQTAH